MPRPSLPVAGSRREQNGGSVRLAIRYNAGDMPTALLFDFDGLIMDTESAELAIWQEIYAAHGVTFPIDTWIQKVVGATIANFDPAVQLVHLSGRDLDVTDLHQNAKMLRAERCSRLGALPGALELAAEARRSGLRLAIVSSSPHAWVDGYLRQIGASQLFDLIICREDAPRLKPAPDLYLKALECLGLPAQECLAFEDSPNGILAAQRAGLRVVGVPNPVTAHAGALQAELVLPTLKGVSLETLRAAFPEQGASSG